MHYTCSCCGKPVGLMADKNGVPQMFKCPHTGRIAAPQAPVKRDTPRPTLVGRIDVLRQSGKRIKEEDE